MGGRARVGAATRVEPGPTPGFTLIELLAVIAILSVLAALLIPTATDALARGRTMRCMNSTRQMVAVGLAWSAEHGGKLTPYRQSDPPFATNSVVYWSGLLESAVGGSGKGGTPSLTIESLVTCPEMTDRAQTFSAWGPVYSIAWSSLLGGWEDSSCAKANSEEACRSPNLGEIVYPSQTALAGDSVGPSSLAMGANTWAGQTFDDPSARLFRHLNRVNIAFCDGSARSLTYAQIPRVGVGRWRVFYFGAGE